MHPSTWAWRLWQCTGRFLVVLEPGTVEGFAHVVATRDALLRRPDGDDAEDAVIARMIAPCPHSGACPLMAGPDGSKGDGSAASGCVSFCHFAQRYERDRLLQQYRRVDRERQLVNTSARNISNRRFSYVILERPSTESPPSSAAAAVAASRVVMAPQKRGGHVILGTDTPGHGALPGASCGRFRCHTAVGCVEEVRSGVQELGGGGGGGGGDGRCEAADAERMAREALYINRFTRSPCPILPETDARRGGRRAARGRRPGTRRRPRRNARDTGAG
eukprot:ctg_3386.g626